MNTTVFYKGENYPEIDENRKNEFARIVAPLNLNNSDTLFILSHIIAYGTIMDYSTFLSHIIENEPKGDVRELFDFIASSMTSDFQKIKIYANDSNGETHTFALEEQNLCKTMVDTMLQCYIDKIIPKLRLSAYRNKGLSNKEIIAEEAARLSRLDLSAKRHFHHRQNTNKRIYCFLALFFGKLHIVECKQNYELMIDLLRMFDLWNKESTATPTSYKLVVRQWHTAKNYDFKLLKSDFSNTADFEALGICMLSTLKYGLPYF